MRSRIVIFAIVLFLLLFTVIQYSGFGKIKSPKDPGNRSLPIGYSESAIAEADRLRGTQDNVGGPSSPASVYVHGLSIFNSNRKQAIIQIEKAATEGCVEAGFTLGRYYLEQGEKSQFAFALAYIRNAADQGIVQAQLDYGLVLLDRNAGHYDPSDGITWLKRAAESRKPAAVKTFVQKLAETGGFISIDELVFLEVEKLAAEDDLARCVVAESLIEVEQMDEAQKYLDKAVANGHPTAQYLIAMNFTDVGSEQYNTLLDQASDGGNCFAALELYQRFRFELSEDTTEAEIQKAVDRLASAIEPLQEMAYSENPQYMYLYGVAIESLATKPTPESVEWIKRSASAGYPDAIISNALNDLSSPNSLIQETGLFALRRLSREGHVPAQLELGRLLVDEKNQSLISEGVSWLEAASLAGDFEAAELLSIAVENGVAVPLQFDELDVETID